jgi:hypothetical protein
MQEISRFRSRRLRRRKRRRTHHSSGVTDPESSGLDASDGGRSDDEDTLERRKGNVKVSSEAHWEPRKARQVEPSSRRGGGALGRASRELPQR